MGLDFIKPLENVRISKKDLNLRSNSLILVYFLIILILGLIISNLSDVSINAFLAVEIAGLFLLGSFLTIKAERNIVNILFSFSLILYFLIAIIALIGYINKDLEFIWTISGFFYLSAPLGFFFSSKILVDKENWFSYESIYILSSTFFLAVISVYFYDPSSKLNVFFADIIVILLLTLTIIHFIELRKIVSQSDNVFYFLFFGFMLAITGLLLNLLSIVIFNKSTIIRLIVPLVGMLFVVISFIILNKNDINTNENLYKTTILKLKGKLDTIVPSLGLYFLDSKEISNQTDPVKLYPIRENLEFKKAFDFSNEQKNEFKLHLKDEMNGLSINILIETAFAYPNGITNSNLRRKLKKSKTTIIDQTKKLISLGYIAKYLDLGDTRKKPIILTHKGYRFLYQLHGLLSNYFKDTEKSSHISSSINDLNIIIEKA
jgi:DNA-binding MarR family transcriptional regulator